jgi:circadian clock protein KaiC
MMEGKGYYRGSSVLVSGTAGAGKTSLAAHFAHAAAARGERCMWFAFEESSSQIIRNMRSIGIDLEPAVRRGMLRFHAERPTIYGLEMHLVTMHKLVNEFKPQVVVIDPVSNFTALGSGAEVKAMLTRLIAFIKTEGITALFTNLTAGDTSLEATDVGISSLMDTWLVMRYMQHGAERNRFLAILKSRGMAHSNQTREFLLTEHGMELRDVYVGPSGDLLAGGARDALEAQEKAQALVGKQRTEGTKRALESKRQALEAQIAALRAEFEVEQAEAAKTVGQDQTRAGVLAGDRAQMARLRQGNAAVAKKTPKRK